MGSNWSDDILEKVAQNNENVSEVVREIEISKPKLPNINCVKTGVDHNSIITPKVVNDNLVNDSVNKLKHREKVFSEIKLFFQFKQTEAYINTLKKEIENIKLKCFMDFEDFNLKFRDLENRVCTNNLINSVSNVSDNLYENNYHTQYKGK